MSNRQWSVDVMTADEHNKRIAHHGFRVGRVYEGVDLPSHFSSDLNLKTGRLEITAITPGGYVEFLISAGGKTLKDGMYPALLAEWLYL